ncbi:MAG: hypothetical protein C00003105_00081 [ANME-2 cluster archaeon HR1]|nr:MAG: hypothetical protein C00003105_00081 [ANME-2 cluster archaeon HR1]
MTATEVTESTERGLGGGKDISVYSVAESYKKQIWFSITFFDKFPQWFLFTKLSLHYSMDELKTESTNTTLLHSTSSSESLLFLKLIGVSIVYSYPFQF